MSTNSDDKQSYYASVPYGVNKSGIRMLHGGLRFDIEANKNYRVPASEYADGDNLTKLVELFLEHHYTREVPRITTLQRYYEGDNDIHYWRADKSAKRADNRIASGHPRRITDTRVGYSMSKGVKYEYSSPDGNDDTTNSDKLMDTLIQYNSSVDEKAHNKKLKKNLSVTGRAYELSYIKSNEVPQYSHNIFGNLKTDVKIVPELMLMNLDPVNTFVVYDTSPEMNALFAVNYYMVDFNNNKQFYVTAYTKDRVITYKPVETVGTELVQDTEEQHYFGDVPVTEYVNNDERLGDWEADLDNIDAYDKALSEMTNSVEDFSNAILVINGDIDIPKELKVPVLDSDGKQTFDADGQPIMKIDNSNPLVETLSKTLYLKPSIINNANGGVTVVPTSAEYLTRELPADDWQKYIDQITSDIYTDTNTPNVADDNFSGNSSGVAMSYKLFGSDQVRENQNDLFTKGLMRRLRLNAHYWFIHNDISDEVLVNNIEPIYTPNLPKNDSEIIANAQAMKSTGAISDETIQGYVSNVTGVKQPEEARRLDDEAPEDVDESVFNDKPDVNKPNDTNDSSQSKVGNDE
jgi:SPP1 family phage portal protein